MNPDFCWRRSFDPRRNNKKSSIWWEQCVCFGHYLGLSISTKHNYNGQLCYWSLEELDKRSDGSNYTGEMNQTHKVYSWFILITQNSKKKIIQIQQTWVSDLMDRKVTVSFVVLRCDAIRRGWHLVILCVQQQHAQIQTCLYEWRKLTA